jgi:hypothetical protein
VHAGGKRRSEVVLALAAVRIARGQGTTCCTMLLLTNARRATACAPCKPQLSLRHQAIAKVVQPGQGIWISPRSSRHASPRHQFARHELEGSGPTRVDQ